MVFGALVWPALALAQEPAPRPQDRVIPDDCFCEIGLDAPSVERADQWRAVRGSPCLPGRTMLDAVQ
jgi:hypothetical protein